MRYDTTLPVISIPLLALKPVAREFECAAIFRNRDPFEGSRRVQHQPRPPDRFAETERVELDAGALLPRDGQKAAVAEYRVFLRKYPNRHPYTEKAKRRIAALTTAK